MPLTTIPRASSVSVSNYDLGQNIGIVIGKKVSSFVSTLKYEIGSLKGTIVEKTSDSNYIWTMTEELINQIKTNYSNTNKVSAKILCDTYNRNTKIGSTQSATFTLTIIDIPTIENIVIEEQNTMVSGLTTDIVKYVSKPKITVNATAPFGTTIKKYYFLKGGNTYNSDTNEYIIENIQDSFMDGDVLKTRFTVYVEDNRGNVSTETIEDRNFIDYVNLAINTTDIKLARLTNVSNTVKLSLTGFVYNGLIGESQNTVSVKYRYKLQSANEWSSFTTIPTTLEGNTFKITNLELAGEFDYKQNYDFEFYATDLLQTTPASTFLLSSTEYAYFFHKNGADFKTLTEGKKRVALKEDLNNVYDAITLYLTGGLTINNSSKKIQFNNSNIVGDKMKVSNGSVLINDESVKYVEISASICGQAGSGLNEVQLLGMIYKNNEQINTGYDFNSTIKMYYFANLTISKFIIPVKKGDTISLYTQLSDNQTLQIANDFKYGTAYMTVEAKGE